MSAVSNERQAAPRSDSRELIGDRSIFPLFIFPPDPLAFGEDLYAEIEAAFDLISRQVEPTACGHAVLARLWALSKEILARWQQVCGCRGLAASEGRAHRKEGQRKRFEETPEPAGPGH